MKALALSATVALVVLAPVPPQELTATFIGNAAVQISDGETTLVSDFPYQSGAFGYMAYDRSTFAPTTPVTLIISHQHADHWSPSARRDDGWRVLGPAAVVSGLARNAVVPMAPEVAVGAATVAPIRTSHANLEHYSYRVSWRGLRLYFTGDTEDPSPLLAESDLDVAFVTPWLLKAVLARAGRMPARQVVVYHHTERERLPECATNCRIPRQGERWSLAQR